ncbi:MAG: DUF3047 domain-containing protein [Candidatus Thermoplasmatota archaeon]|nr:DUF3047 domain-containing protein [Candidatus Thermoplasmatota archaeon]
MWKTHVLTRSPVLGVIVMMIGAGIIPSVLAGNTSMGSVNGIPMYGASLSSSQFFKEDFETGYDGWDPVEGDLSEYGTQSSFVYQGDYSFKMTGIRVGESGFSGRLMYNLTLPVDPDTIFNFAYSFPSKNVSYVGYILIFNTGKWGYYFSLFYGWFVNTSDVYVKQYWNESSGLWHSHTENVYDDYSAAFGEVPRDLSITSVSIMMGDPYFSDEEQTGYYDAIRLGGVDIVQKPTTPVGPTSGKAGIKYNYTTNTTDPYGDDVYYKWDWGDGSYSDWLGPYASGAQITTSHVWGKGSYSIRVKAIDDPNGDGELSDGIESLWSDSLPITMPLTSASVPYPFFRYIFERFPHAFPMLRQLMGC